MVKWHVLRGQVGNMEKNGTTEGKKDFDEVRKKEHLDSSNTNDKEILRNNTA